MIKITLNDIRAKSPGKDSWEKLLKSLDKTKADAAAKAAYAAKAANNAYNAKATNAAANAAYAAANDEHTKQIELIKQYLG